MPTYEYACKSCGEHLEVVQSFKDDPLTTCPACGGPLRKVFGTIGITFKGSGFYRTDSRQAPPSEKGAADKGASEKTGSGASEAGGSGSSGSSGSEGKSSEGSGNKSGSGSSAVAS